MNYGEAAARRQLARQTATNSSTFTIAARAEAYERLHFSPSLGVFIVCCSSTCCFDVVKIIHFAEYFSMTNFFVLIRYCLLNSSKHLRELGIYSLQVEIKAYSRGDVSSIDTLKYLHIYIYMCHWRCYLDYRE